jgi:hypothetical protein
MKKQSFKDYVIVSCGTIAPEINYLKNSKFLDAKKFSENIIVVYGGKYCYINIKEPYKTIDDIAKQQSKNISRINASQ